MFEYTKIIYICKTFKFTYFRERVFLAELLNERLLPQPLLLHLPEELLVPHQHETVVHVDPVLLLYSLLHYAHQEAEEHPALLDRRQKAGVYLQKR